MVELSLQLKHVQIHLNLQVQELNALAGTAIDITSGSGTGHTLTGETATATASLGASSLDFHAGWVRRTVGTGGRAGRISYETLLHHHLLLVTKEMI